MNSITFLILTDDIKIDDVAAHLGAHLIEDFNLHQDQVRCVSLNESDILRSISELSTKHIVQIADISRREETLSTNPVYQALVFLRNKYTLNKSRKILYGIEKEIATDIMSVLTIPEEKRSQSDLALLNAIRIIGLSEDVYEYISEAKVFKSYIAVIKKIYNLYKILPGM